MARERHQELERSRGVRRDQAPLPDGRRPREAQNDSVGDARQHEHGPNARAAGLGSARLLQLPEPVANPELGEQVREADQFHRQEQSEPKGRVCWISIHSKTVRDKATRDDNYYRDRRKQGPRRNPQQDAHRVCHNLMEIEKIHAVALEIFRQSVTFYAIGISRTICRSPRVRPAEGVSHPNPYRYYQSIKARYQRSSVAATTQQRARNG